MFKLILLLTALMTLCITPNYKTNEISRNKNAAKLLVNKFKLFKINLTKPKRKN